MKELSWASWSVNGKRCSKIIMNTNAQGFYECNDVFRSLVGFSNEKQVLGIGNHYRIK